MKKRIISLMLSTTLLISLFMVGMPSTAWATDENPTIIEPVFFRFDFNNQSLEATTDGGGRPNSLVRADASGLAQEWTDTTIKFSATKTVDQYYELATPVLLEHDKQWLVEWNGSTETGNGKHSTIFMSDTSTDLPWLHINKDNGTLRLAGPPDGADDSTAYSGVKNSDFHTYVLKNVPDENGIAHIYYSFDGSDFTLISNEKFIYDETDITIKYLFGKGYNNEWNYKGQMDYFTIYTDVGSAPVRSVYGKELAINGGAGTTQSPYTAEVELPYTTSVIDKGLLNDRIVNFQLYDDAEFTNAVSSVNVSNVPNHMIYFSADGAYYSVKAEFKVDLSQDSAIYKFDFNGGLETSGDGLYNRILPQNITEAAPLKFSDDNTYINVLSENSGDTNINGSAPPSVLYPLEKVIPLDYNKNWKVSFRAKNQIKYGALLAESNTNFIHTTDWQISWTKAGSRTRFGAESRYENKWYDVVLENIPNQSTNTIRVKRKPITAIEWVNNYTVTIHATAGMDINYFFYAGNAATNTAFKGYVDYMYIDTDKDLTAAMEFLHEHAEAINAEEVSEATLQDILVLISKYAALSAESKAYINRGESEKISRLKAMANSYAITKVCGEDVVLISGTGDMSSPLKYSVTLPYNVLELSAEDIIPLDGNDEISLYSDSAFSNAVSIADLKGSYSHEIYVKVGDAYSILDITNKVDLTKDSGKYYFDFNGSLSTSENGLPNSISEITTVGTTYNDDTTALKLNDQGYEIANTVLLKHDSEWEVQFGLTWKNQAKQHTILTPAQSNANSYSINFNDRMPNLFDGNNRLTPICVFDGSAPSYYGLANIEWKITNTLADGVSSLKTNYRSKGTTLWSNDFVYTPDENIVAIDKDFALTNMFSMPNALWFRAIDVEYDYMYIDTDKNLTAAMEYIKNFEDIFAGNEVSDEMKKEAVIAYYSLNNESKAYLVRGEADIINGFKSMCSGTVVISNDGTEIFVANVGKALVDAKLVVCFYKDNALDDMVIKDINAAADEMVSVNVSENYADAESVKAILIDSFGDIKPLADFLSMK